MDEMPVFSNSCGKIYTDNVVFAFSNGEKELTMEKIKAVRFTERLTPRSLAFILLPLLVYPAIDHIKNFNGLFRVGGYVAMFGVAAMAFDYSEKEYSISVVMNDRSKMTIRVSKDNRKDAKKFVDKLKQNSGL
jgi:hypothetical protein